MHQVDSMHEHDRRSDRSSKAVILINQTFGVCFFLYFSNFYFFSSFYSPFFLKFTEISRIFPYTFTDTGSFRFILHIAHFMYRSIYCTFSNVIRSRKYRERGGLKGNYTKILHYIGFSCITHC